MTDVPTGAATLGFECYAYYNSGSYDSPTWVEITPIRDLTLPNTDDEVDVTSRESGGNKEVLQGLRDFGVEFDAVYNTADTAFAAILSGYTGRTNVEFLILDGPEATSGSQGVRAIMAVTKCTRKEELAGAVMAEIAAKPTKNADSPAAWFTAA